MSINGGIRANTLLVTARHRLTVGAGQDKSLASVWTAPCPPRWRESHAVRHRGHRVGAVLEHALRSERQAFMQ